MNRSPENRSALALVFSLLLSAVIGAQTGAGSVSGRPTHLYRCSFYSGEAAGEKLGKMLLTMGSSRPWPEELGGFTGEKKKRHVA